MRVVLACCRCGNKAAIVDIDEEMNHKIIQVRGCLTHTAWRCLWRLVCVRALVLTGALAGLLLRRLASCLLLTRLLCTVACVQFDHAPPKGAGITEVKRTVPEYFL